MKHLFVELVCPGRFSLAFHPIVLFADLSSLPSQPAQRRAAFTTPASLQCVCLFAPATSPCVLAFSSILIHPISKMGDAVLDSPLVECPDTQRHTLSASSAGAEADSCYCKVLVTNHLAGIIIGQAGNEIRTLKNTTGAKIVSFLPLPASPASLPFLLPFSALEASVLSPHGMYFPGTTERIAAIEGPEQSVFQVLDWILDKMVDQRQLIDLPHDHHQQQLQLQLQQQQQQQEEEQQQSVGGIKAAVSSGLLSPSGFPPRATCFRICVPRAVVGCLIGKNGGYIQSLRVATGAAINVSPLFVTAEEACAERVVSVESRRRQSLKTAAFTLVRKINTHPERASCRHVCYFRKHSFEASLPDVPSAVAQAPAQEFRFIRQQQQLQLQQQLQQQHQQQQQLQEIEALRKRTVSLVMGAAGGSSLPPSLVDLREAAASDQQQQQQQQQQQRAFSGLSSSASKLPLGGSVGENQFAAFKRFCELRSAGKGSRSCSGSTARPSSRELSLTLSPSLSVHPEGGATASLTPASQADAVAAAAVAAVAAAAAVNGSSGIKPANNPWDICPSSACSTAVGSTDRLPVLTEEAAARQQSQPGGSLQQQQQQQLMQQQQRMQQHQQQALQQQQQPHYPSIVLLAIIALLLAALLRLLMQNN
ncbi:hypothetical protein Efla_001438 [Eimeria flavescens]